MSRPITLRGVDDKRFQSFIPASITTAANAQPRQNGCFFGHGGWYAGNTNAVKIVLSFVPGCQFRSAKSTSGKDRDHSHIPSVPQALSIGFLKEQVARCFVPSFGGAYFSREWKEALWDRYYTEAPQ
jgi:hypothetical protein